MRVLVFSHSLIRRDPRLLRQIKWLKELGFEEIVSIGLGSKPASVDKHIRIPQLSLHKRVLGYLLPSNQTRFQYFYGRFLDDQVKDFSLHPDLLVINGIEYLSWKPFSSSRLNSIPMYLDIHEDHINQAYRSALERFAFKRYWEWQLRVMIDLIKQRKAPTKISSVEPELASMYGELTNQKIEVIMNAPQSNSLQAQNCNPAKIKLVHHGMGTKGRGIEQIVYALKKLDKRFTLDLILFPTLLFKIKLLFLIEIMGVRGRIKLRSGVPLEKLPLTLNEFDISIILLSNKVPGHLHSLPNKFFESMHSGLSVVSGPNPTMSKIILEENIGKVLNDWSSSELSNCLNGLSVEEIVTFKQNSKLAAEKYADSVSEKTFKNIIKNLA